MSLLVIIKQKIPKTLFLNVIGIDGIWVISIVVKEKPSASRLSYLEIIE
jgi:hypothetical protein